MNEYVHWSIFSFGRSLEIVPQNQTDLTENFSLIFRRFLLSYGAKILHSGHNKYQIVIEFYYINGKSTITK
jgi:hypothetical protein